jgi:hypothetical protein
VHLMDADAAMVRDSVPSLEADAAVAERGIEAAGLYDDIVAIEACDSVPYHAESVWDRALRNNLLTKELERESRDLQDEIYEHRRTSPLIFDRIYKLLRIRHEDQMNKAAAELVREALAFIDLGIDKKP